MAQHLEISFRGYFNCIWQQIFHCTVMPIPGNCLVALMNAVIEPTFQGQHWPHGDSWSCLRTAKWSRVQELRLQVLAGSSQGPASWAAASARTVPQLTSLPENYASMLRANLESLTWCQILLQRRASSPSPQPLDNPDSGSMSRCAWIGMAYQLRTHFCLLLYRAA